MVSSLNSLKTPQAGLFILPIILNAFLSHVTPTLTKTSTLPQNLAGCTPMHRRYNLEQFCLVLIQFLVSIFSICTYAYISIYHQMSFKFFEATHIYGPAASTYITVVPKLMLPASVFLAFPYPFFNLMATTVHV